MSFAFIPPLSVNAALTHVAVGHFHCMLLLAYLLLCLSLKHAPAHLTVCESAMEEENNQSSETARGSDEELSKAVNDGGGGNREEKLENNDDQMRARSNSSSDCAVRNSSRGESKTLTSSVQMFAGDSSANFDESSHLLSEVPVEYALAVKPPRSAAESKDQVKPVHVVSLKGTPCATTMIQTHVPDGPSKLGVSPASVTKQDKLNSPDPQPSSIKHMLKTSDGYNWRKYGQKQVKSPEGSRSYYRCTFSDCLAKKIECCDQSHRLIETVYRSLHTHDPPQKVNCVKDSVHALPVAPVNESNDPVHLLTCSSEPVQDNLSEKTPRGTDEINNIKKQELSDSDETTEINMEEYVDGAKSKKREKRNATGELESPSKPAKKPKYVVHAAGDMEISGDGYRWRKYGQKTVKGNPHPRNYYRCTSAGCPVRKHIETDIDSVNAVVITYKGVHDHDTPVPRKRSGPKNRTQWSVDKEGELTGESLNAAGENSSESARTLVSVGFEIKPC